MSPPLCSLIGCLLLLFRVIFRLRRSSDQMFALPPSPAARPLLFIGTRIPSLVSVCLWLLCAALPQRLLLPPTSSLSLNHKNHTSPFSELGVRATDRLTLSKLSNFAQFFPRSSSPNAAAALFFLCQPHPGTGSPSGPTGQGASSPGEPSRPGIPSGPGRPRLPRSPSSPF